MRRPCGGVKADGSPCRAAPLTDSAFCAMHDPDNAEAVAQGRRLGGLRRKRESTLGAAYDLGDIRSAEGLWRVLEVAILDTFALDNGIQRVRTLIQGVRTGSDLKRTTDLEARMEALERAIPRRPPDGLPPEGLLDAGRNERKP